MENKKENKLVHVEHIPAGGWYSEKRAEDANLFYYTPLAVFFVRHYQCSNGETLDEFDGYCRDSVARLPSCRNQTDWSRFVPKRWLGSCAKEGHAVAFPEMQCDECAKEKRSEAGEALPLR